MARLALIKKEQRKAHTVNRFKTKREGILEKLEKLYQDPINNAEEIMTLSFKLQSFPRNSSPCRQRRRCKITGRARGVYRKVGFSRTKFRELVMNGYLPGFVKSSW